MSRDTTRREYVKYGGTLAAGGFIAGCSTETGDSEADSGSSGDDGAESGVANESGTDAGNESTAEGDGADGYSVTMEPVGTVEFEEVPERWFPYTGDYADMGVALGQADGLAAIGLRSRYGTHYYEELPGVSVDKTALSQLYQEGTGKEQFYAIDADVHLIDPNFMINRLGWDRSDVDEIRQQVAPFVGNTTFSRVYDWHDYADYSMYEAFEKVAELFQQQERYAAFESLHDEVVGSVQNRLPDETPDIAVLFPAGVPPESFYPYLIGGGTQSKQWRDLGVGDALAANDVTDAQAGGGTIDYESLLAIDPDALAIRMQGDVSDEQFREQMVSHLESHEIASELTAVQNGRVVYGGMTYQGPIIHLFQLERAARGLYPDEFGDEQLFDRKRVAAIITGEFEQ